MILTNLMGQHILMYPDKEIYDLKSLSKQSLMHLSQYTGVGGCNSATHSYCLQVLAYHEIRMYILCCIWARHNELSSHTCMVIRNYTNVCTLIISLCSEGSVCRDFSVLIRHMFASFTGAHILSLLLT